VVHGEPGVGKSVLLDYLSELAAGCQVARATGVQSEMELAFAGLHQLLAPMLDRVDDLPVPQRDALRTVFGMETGSAPDRFLVGLGVLSLLSDAAGERPLICLVDDEQWLDHASVQVLGFVARRLGADPVAMVFATRMPSEELAGLPRLAVDGLREQDARALLNSVLTRSLDEQVRDQLIAETRGNPLALLELPRGLSPAELAGGFGLPAAVPLTDRIEESFRRQLDALPPDTLRLLRLAAAETSGDATLVWRAAQRLGIPFQAAASATESGIAKFGARVRFRHPLLRSAAYRSASPAQRLDMHKALAEVIDPLADPDRRAWHRAQAAAGPDEAVAAELERCAGRARDRGGLAAAAAFLERSALLTADPASRAERTLAAAHAKLQAGDFDKALELVAAAEAGPLDGLQGARADLLRGQIAFASGPGSDAPPLLLKAAKRLEPLDLDLARQTYVDAWQAAVFAGHLAGAGDLLEVSHAARALPPPSHPPRPVDLLLDGFAVLAIDGLTAAAPLLRQATTAFARADLPVEESLQWGWLARVADKTLWDDVGLSITGGQVRLAREAGALDHLSIVLNMMAMDAVWGGDLVAAASVVAEEDAVRGATGSRNLPYGAMMLAAYRGREQEAAPLIQATAEQVMAGGQGAALTNAYWMAAILYNGLGRYADALTAARQASEHRHLYASSWAWPELIEAAVRTGGADEARAVVELLAGTTRAGGTDLGLGVEARCRALLAEGDAAEGYYREALDRLARTRRRPDLARAHLLYGEWLRRERRRGDAQEQLRSACRMLDEMGMEAFAERARRELRAAGETIRKLSRGSAGDGTTLTAQEAQVARLAADGLSNPEIVTRLFISARTVQYHLSKVFSKLGIGSRTELHRVLPGEPDLAVEG
jgi:DNA-binding CsgD family transcriptional regulator